MLRSPPIGQRCPERKGSSLPILEVDKSVLTRALFLLTERKLSRQQNCPATIGAMMALMQ